SLSTHLFARRPDVRTSQAIDTLRHEHADAVTELEHRSRTGHAALLAGSGSPNNAPLVGAQHANRPHVYRPPLSSGTIPSQEPHPKLRPRPLADERRPFPSSCLPACGGRLSKDLAEPYRRARLRQAFRSAPGAPAAPRGELDPASDRFS